MFYTGKVETAASIPQSERISQATYRFIQLLHKCGGKLYMLGCL